MKKANFVKYQRVLVAQLTDAQTGQDNIFFNVGRFEVNDTGIIFSCALSSKEPFKRKTVFLSFNQLHKFEVFQTLDDWKIAYNIPDGFKLPKT